MFNFFLFCFIFYGLTSFAPTWKNSVPNVFNVKLWWDSFPVWLNLWKNCTVTKHTVVNYMRMWNICINILLNEIKSTFRLCDAFAIEKTRYRNKIRMKVNKRMAFCKYWLSRCGIVLLWWIRARVNWNSGLAGCFVYIFIAVLWGK